MEEKKQSSCHIKDITPRTYKNSEYLNEQEYSLALEKFYSGKERFVKTSWLNFSTERIYMTSNEDLAETHRFLGSLEGQRVLTVGSSFDQVLNAIMNGSKDITLMDANILSKYYGEYKMAMIKNLDFKTFSSLYKSNGVGIVSPKVYKKIFQDLSKDSQVFWGTIFLDQETPILTKIQMFHFSYETESEFYHSKEAYNLLREKLNDVDLKFCLAEFRDCPNYADGKYGYINLSNVFDYIPTSVFKKVIRQLYDNNLTDGGNMQVYYSFNNPLPKKKVLKDLLFNVQRHFTLDGESSYILKKPIKENEDQELMEKE